MKKRTLCEFLDLIRTEAHPEKSLLFDFCSYNDNKISLIEFNGIQHYELTKFTNSADSTLLLEEQRTKDQIKKNYCTQNNIPFLIIPYWEKGNINNILFNFLKKEKNDTI